MGVDHGGVHRVDTEQGSIEAEVVVNAGGIYAPEIGTMAGLTLPIIPMAHQYLLARVKDEIPEALPTMRDPDLLVYFRRDAGGLVMGGYERDPAGPRAGARRCHQADQWTGGLHARQRVRSRRVERSRALCRGRLLRSRDRRCGWHGRGDGGMDHRWRAEPRSLEDGPAAVRRRLPEAGLHARPHGRGLLDLL